MLLTTVNKTGATSRAGTAYPSEHLSHVARSLVVCVMFCRTLFILFLLAIVLSVFLRFMASDYIFGIFKLLAIVLSVLLQFMASDYIFGIFKLLAIVLSVFLQFMTSDYIFGIFKLFLYKILT